MLKPHLQRRWEEIRVIHRRRGDVDTAGAVQALVGKLGAAGAAEPANHSLRGSVNERTAGQHFDLPTVEGQPRDRGGGARPAARCAVANTRINRLSGDAKPNRRAEAAAFDELHAFPPVATLGTAHLNVPNLSKTRGQRIRLVAAASHGMPTFGAPRRGRILEACPHQFGSSAASPVAAPPA